MNKLFLSFLSIVLFLPLAAQPGTITTTVNFDDNTFTASQLTLDLPMDQVKDYWDDFWDERYDIDVDREDRNRNSETFLAEQVRLAAVSDKAFDLWSKLGELSESQTTVSIAISFGYDISATPDNFPQAFNEARSYLEEFRIFAYDRYYTAQIEEVESQLEDIRDDREDAVDDQEKSNRRIERWEDKIAKLEERIAEERATITEEENTEENKAERIAELERRLSELQRSKARYTR